MTRAEHMREYRKTYNTRNPEWWKRIQRAKNKRHYEKIKMLIFERYGKECNLCGSTNKLELDHVHPLVGREFKQAISEWINSLVFPKRYFQILCKSCNIEKRGKDNASY